MALTITAQAPLVGGVASVFRFAQTATIAPSSIAATTVTALTGTLSGLTTDMTLVIQQVTPAVNAAAVHAECSAADTLKIFYVNPTAGAVTPTSGTYRILAL